MVNWLKPTRRNLLRTISPLGAISLYKTALAKTPQNDQSSSIDTIAIKRTYPNGRVLQTDVSISEIAAKFIDRNAWNSNDHTSTIHASSDSCPVITPEQFAKPGEQDEAFSVQRAIDFAAERANGQVVMLPRTYRCHSPIILRPGTILDGLAAPGYYSGLQYYQATPQGIKGGRLIAMERLNSGLLQLDKHTDFNRGFDIRNLTIDANKLALYGLECSGDSSAIKEAQLRLTDVDIQGAVSDGLYHSAIIVVRTVRLTISACHGYGFNAAYGVSDSEHFGLYVHTCDAGGIQVGEGCRGIRFIGGKIEDNYGHNVNIYVSGSDASTEVFFLGTSIQVANGDGIHVDGGSVYVQGGCWFLNNRNPGKAAIRCERGTVIVESTRFEDNFNSIAAGNIGRIVATNCDFISSFGEHFSSQDESEIEIVGGQIAGRPIRHSAIAVLDQPAITRLQFKFITIGVVTGEMMPVITYRVAIVGINESSDDHAFIIDGTLAIFPINEPDLLFVSGSNLNKVGLSSVSFRLINKKIEAFVAPVSGIKLPIRISISLSEDGTPF